MNDLTDLASVAATTPAPLKDTRKADFEANKLSKRLHHQVGLAITDFNMIEAGDKVMVCLSGGKDSYTMLDILLSLRRRAPIDFDIELAKKQSAENPVYYVQYAHARIASIVRKAGEAGLAPAASVAGTLDGAPEAALARAIVRYPEVVEDAVLAEETHGVTAYATELATTFHAFYRDARVIDEAEPERSRARLALAEAARITLASSLGLLGISAPDRM
jgi:glycyl-tRNA synthetase beta subunit